MTDPRPRSPLQALPPSRPPWALGATVAGVLLLHGALLGAWSDGTVVAPGSAPGAAPVQIRRVVLQPTAAAAAKPAQGLAQPAKPLPQDKAESAAESAAEGASPPAPRVAGAARAAQAQADHPAPDREAVALAAAAPAASAVLPILLPALAEVARVASPAAVEAIIEAEPAPAAVPPAASATAQPVPVYSTQAAPAATMVFDLKRGMAAGQATLRWWPHKGPDGLQYTLTLQAQAFGIDVAAWNSSGRFDADGLAPGRYAESRRGREVRATNFQRAAGKISFSAQSSAFDIAPGAQDRSSWMLQLGAVLNANPAQALPGAQTTLVVVGTRGAPEPWVFTVVDRGPLTLGGAASSGPTETTPTVHDAVQLLREPRHPYDTRARIWLDPARHHLPLKVQLLVHGTGEGQEFELRELRLP